MPLLRCIRKNISFGYNVFKFQRDGKNEGFPQYRATDWEPLEISIVSVPADVSIGIGRSTSENHLVEVPEGFELEQSEKRSEEEPEKEKIYQPSLDSRKKLLDLQSK